MLTTNVTILISVCLVLGILAKYIFDLGTNKKFTEQDIRGGALTLVIVICILFAHLAISNLTNKEEICKLPNSYGKIDKTRMLINAIAKYESDNDTTAKNPNSTASGHLQILKILVKDANRIIGKEKYKYRDRFSREKAEEIWHIIQNYYNPKGDVEIAIRLWNQGCGYTKENSQHYFEEVYSIYNKNIDAKLDTITEEANIKFNIALRKLKSKNLK